MKIDKELVYKVIHDHKNEILNSNDWWWAIGDHDLNVFCYEDDPDLPDSLFNINLYEIGYGFSAESQYDLPSMTRREIRLL